MQIANGFPVFDSGYPRIAHGGPRFADPAARTNRPVGNRPQGVAPKVGGALAPLHWLNAQIVGAHSAKHTNRRGQP